MQELSQKVHKMQDLINGELSDLDEAVFQFKQALKSDRADMLSKSSELWLMDMQRHATFAVAMTKTLLSLQGGNDSVTGLVAKKFLTPNKVGIWALIDENGVIWFTFYELCTALFECGNHYPGVTQLKKLFTDEEIKIIRCNREGHQKVFKNMVINQKSAIEFCDLVKRSNSKDILKNWLINFDFYSSQNVKLRSDFF